jgi:hypothetical protein
MPQRRITAIRMDRISAWFVQDPAADPAETSVPDVDFMLLRRIAAGFAAATVVATHPDRSHDGNL